MPDDADSEEGVPIVENGELKIITIRQWRREFIKKHGEEP